MPPTADGPIELLVVGGSQGARFFSGIMPAAVAALPAELRARLRVAQQARPEDREAVAGEQYPGQEVVEKLPGYLSRNRFARFNGQKLVSRFAFAGLCGLPVFHNRAYRQIR